MPNRTGQMSPLGGEREAPPSTGGPTYALRRSTARTAAPHPTENSHMLLYLAIALFVLWALGFLAFHITVAAFHVILLVAVIALIMHFVRGRASTV